MKILLFGGDGQVGWELQRALAPLGRLHVARRTQADFAHPERLVAFIGPHAPDVIVNAAAYTDVDQAEHERDLCHAVNAGAPGALAEISATSGALLVHYSSDFVFDGSGTEAHDEDAVPAPLSVYGHSKLDGERRIRAAGARHLILRTSWVHAPRRRNFVRRILQLAAERDVLDVVDDQIGAPTGADLIADLTAHALRGGLTGTYHGVAAGFASRFEVARLIVDCARACGHPARAALRAVTTVRGQGAARPLNSRLTSHRLQRDGGLHLPPWQQGVERTVHELLSTSP